MTIVPQVRIDQRLLDGGLTVTVRTLCDVFADHFAPVAGLRGPATCPKCGHVVTAQAPECPSLAMARQLLARRRLESPKEVPEWIREALKKGAPKLPRSGRQAPGAECTEPNLELFDVTPYRRQNSRGGGHG